MSGPKYFKIIAASAELFIKHSLTNEDIDYPLIKSRVKDYEVKGYESFEEMKIMLLHSPR
jgi:hypothetical protein